MAAQLTYELKLFKPFFIKWRPLIRLVGTVFPVFFATPFFDFDGIHRSALQFFISNFAKFLARGHRRKIFMDEAIHDSASFFCISNQTRSAKDDNTAELERELQGDIGWEHLAQLAHFKTNF